ncbi:uncharacterized protein LOC129322209 [Prosopis cineraria]|uniref:uncharacterized protein LOC129322209 n=1 Tax=Prosopis cineraria TaxID=364024 RepID=UPI00240F0377|nr:uncharacterized protein LOC129322209 [Prosopis cineraria]XP_054824344.1 uncharacterized protein LOC129322209 [Prosopis cineraria]
MEKLTMPYDKEYMRIAILKHEETFKEQLYELHRLYRVQKTLMKDMDKSRGNEPSQRGWSFKTSVGLAQNVDQNKGTPNKPQLNFDLEQPAEEHIAESDDDRVLEIVDETEIELTLGPSIYNRMKKLETPRTSDSGHSLSSSSTGSSHINKTSSGTHHCSCSDATREELSGGILGLVQVPDSNSICQRGIRNSFDVEEQSSQDRLKQPPWLFQVLSLNMT